MPELRDTEVEIMVLASTFNNKISILTHSNGSLKYTHADTSDFSPYSVEYRDHMTSFSDRAF